MPRDERVALIERIEKLRESRVLVYVTGDRPPAGTQLANDAVRPIYDHLRDMGHVAQTGPLHLQPRWRHRRSVEDRVRPPPR